MSEDYVVKIADFGLSREEPFFIEKDGADKPLKWMALESIIEGKYSEKSDVVSGDLKTQILTGLIYTFYHLHSYE